MLERSVIILGTVQQKNALKNLEPFFFWQLIVYMKDTREWFPTVAPVRVHISPPSRFHNRCPNHRHHRRHYRQASS